ncbi:hypothetical protein Tco_0053249 [Tanacetum coccineum]
MTYQKAKDAQAKEIVALKKRIQRLERKKMSRPTSLKRLKKVGMSRRVESSEDQESLGAPEDASKQGRNEQSTKPDDSTSGEAVTIASVDDSVVPTTIEEITLTQTLIQIKAAKPKVFTITWSVTHVRHADLSRDRDKGLNNLSLNDLMILLVSTILLGLKRLHGFLEVTAAQVHNGNYAKCAAGGKITTV